ncbi:hypothetical protein GOBAR_DD28917 [Gossypium barbadense]|nr:hypothetical protein GOBAR_DD28917 [Gossypium barbadense]
MAERVDALGGAKPSFIKGSRWQRVNEWGTKLDLDELNLTVSLPIHSFSTKSKRVGKISRQNLVTRASSASSSGSVVTLLDYGAGNVRSLRNAIRYLGFEIEDVRTPKDILNAGRLIFPGVGAFASAMDVLVKTGMDEALCTYIRNDRPFLGICLGLQLLFEYSEENGPVKGLGLIPGVVGRFNSSNGFRVHHIGWNALQIAKDSEILDEIGDRHDYFVHSYRAIPRPTQGKASKLAKRVIACLDFRTNDKGDLVVTKGDQYDVREQTKENEVRNLGKPVELSGHYYKDGADEVSFLNITGFRDFPLGDLPMLQVLRHASQNVFVPLTVGGGIRDFTDANGRYYSSLEVASEYFRSGADKISIGTDAVYAAEEYLKTKARSFTSLGLVKTGKSSLEQISRVYGNQFSNMQVRRYRWKLMAFLSLLYGSQNQFLDFTKTFNGYAYLVSGPNGEVYAWYQCTVNGGREGRPIGAYELAKAVEELRAGEILLNCIDCDGQGKGFDIDLINLISDAVSIPVIASSGAGAVKHFSEVFTKTNASAALAAGIFHRKEVPIQSVKGHLLKEGIEKLARLIYTVVVVDNSITEDNLNRLKTTLSDVIDLLVNN